MKRMYVCNVMYLFFIEFGFGAAGMPMSETALVDDF